MSTQENGTQAAVRRDVLGRLMQATISESFAFFLTSFLIAISIVTGTEQRDAVCRMVLAAKESE